MAFFSQQHLRRLDLILNNRSWAFTIHPQYTIALLTGQHRTPTDKDAFQVTGPSANLKEFENAANNQGVTVPVLSLGSARVVPLVPTQMHADVLAKLRRGVQFDALKSYGLQENFKDAAAASHLVPYAELHETQQRHLFSHSTGDPVWKGRSFDQYDPHGRDRSAFVCGMKFSNSSRESECVPLSSSVFSLPITWRTPVRTRSTPVE